MLLLDRLKLMKNPILELDDQTLLTILDMSRDIILERLYPFGSPIEEEILESRYHTTQLRIAIFITNTLGVEGQHSHSEAGVIRVFGSQDIPFEYTRDIMPKKAVIK